MTLAKKKIKTVKNPKVPRTRAGNEWTEARFWQFMRTGLRQMSQRWPPIVRHALEAAKRPSQSDNPRLKWEYQCAECGGWFPRKEVQVDHIYPCGQLNNFDDMVIFAELLFCESDKLAILCCDCHNKKTHVKLEKGE
jgi:hypothetical protein